MGLTPEDFKELGLDTLVGSGDDSVAVSGIMKTVGEHLAKFDPLVVIEKIPDMTDDPLSWLDEPTPTPSKKFVPYSDHEVIEKAPLDLPSLASASVGDATAGTTVDSKLYMCIASCEQPHLRVGARYVPEAKSLSIRVEGSSLGAMHKELVDNAKMNVVAGYASIHAQCDDVILARKTVASVLAAIGIQWDSIKWTGIF